MTRICNANTQAHAHTNKSPLPKESDPVIHNKYRPITAKTTEIPILGLNFFPKNKLKNGTTII